jgi:hypothetical protein
MRMDGEVHARSGTYPWSLVTQIYHSDQPSHAGDRNDLNLTKRNP